MSRFSYRCGICGRFISDADCRDAVITAKYAYALSLEPPDDIYNHRQCHERQAAEWREMSARNAHERTQASA